MAEYFWSKSIKITRDDLGGSVYCTISSGTYGNAMSQDLGNKNVAIKAWRLNATDPMANTNASKQLKQEVETLSKLNHRGVVRLLDFDLASSQAFLVMELCDGDLACLLEKHDKQVLFKDYQAFLVSLIQQLLEAYRYLHSENGIYHVNVKPANVLYVGKEKDFTVGMLPHFKLCDFAYTSREEIISNSYASPDGKGRKIYWGPPELLSDRPFLPERIDIWSLGHVIYYAACPRSMRKPIFDQDTISHLIKQQHQKARATIEKAIESNVHSEYPMVADLVCRMMLVENPSERPRIVSLVGHPATWTGIDFHDRIEWLYRKSTEFENEDYQNCIQRGFPGLFVWKKQFPSEVQKIIETLKDAKLFENNRKIGDLFKCCRHLLEHRTKMTNSTTILATVAKTFPLALINLWHYQDYQHCNIDTKAEEFKYQWECILSELPNKDNFKEWLEAKSGSSAARLIQLAARYNRLDIVKDVIILKPDVLKEPLECDSNDINANAKNVASLAIIAAIEAGDVAMAEVILKNPNGGYKLLKSKFEPGKAVKAGFLNQAANAKKTGNTSACHLALQKQNQPMIELLFKDLKDHAFGWKDATQRTIFHTAAEYGHAVLIKRAVEKSSLSDLEELLGAMDNTGNTALHQACRMSHLDVVKLLLSRDTQTFNKCLNQQNKYKQTALHLACFSGNFAIIQCLVDTSLIRQGDHASSDEGDAHKRFINTKGNAGLTALHVAFKHHANDKSITNLLKMNGARIDISEMLHEEWDEIKRSKGPKTWREYFESQITGTNNLELQTAKAFFLAIAAKSPIDTLAELFQLAPTAINQPLNGYGVYSCEKTGALALRECVKSLYVDGIVFLLEKCNVTFIETFSKRENALDTIHQALKTIKNKRVLALLLSRSLQNIATLEDVSIFHMAVEFGHYSIVESFLRNNFSDATFVKKLLMSKDSRGCTVLHKVASKRKRGDGIKFVKFSLDFAKRAASTPEEFKAFVSTKANSGLAAITIARNNSNQNVVKLLQSAVSDR